MFTITQLAQITPKFSSQYSRDLILIQSANLQTLKSHDNQKGEAPLMININLEEQDYLFY